MSLKNYWKLQKSTCVLLFHFSGHVELEKVFFLVRSEILGLLFNKLPSNNEYFCQNRDLPFQMQLPETQRPFAAFLLHFQNLH